MAFTNFETKEINAKVIYFGPPASGKTSNLRAIFSATSPEVKSGIIELTERPEPTQFFDFLPVSLGRVQDFHLKLHLFSVGIDTPFTTLLPVITKGIDGYIYVADSAYDQLAANLEYWDQTRKLLTTMGYSIPELPYVAQYNKRDIQNAVPVDILRGELNPSGGPDVEAIATQSVGTLETLQLLSKSILAKLLPR